VTRSWFRHGASSFPLHTRQTGGQLVKRADPSLRHAPWAPSNVDGFFLVVGVEGCQ